MLKSKADWAKLGGTVESRGNDLSKEEWSNIAQFLRPLYQVGDDMKIISGGMDSGKKKEAETIISEFQTLIKQADGPTRSQDASAFIKINKRSGELMDNFMDLLRDVPDEI